jgi:hypothetical protein
MDHLHMAITWTCVVGETVPYVNGLKQVVQAQIQSFYNPCWHMSWSSSQCCFWLVHESS